MCWSLLTTDTNCSNTHVVFALVFVGTCCLVFKFVSYVRCMSASGYPTLGTFTLWIILFALGKEPLEIKYREEMGNKHGIDFSNLITLANMPVIAIDQTCPCHALSISGPSRESRDSYWTRVLAKHLLDNLERSGVVGLHFRRRLIRS